MSPILWVFRFVDLTFSDVCLTFGIKASLEFFDDHDDNNE
jgi:hypothetical protein